MNQETADTEVEDVETAPAAEVLPEVEETETAPAAEVLLEVEESTDNEIPKITNLDEIERLLEGAIFTSPKALSMQKMRNLLRAFNYDTDCLRDVLSAMVERWTERGIQLVRSGGGYQFRSNPILAEPLQKLLEDKPTRLSASALEVLAIVAYKQPVTRSEIDSVRGVDSGHLMRGLLEKNLVRTMGHAETPGRPLLYGTAPYFLEVFGLGNLDDLPAIEEMDRELVGSKSGSSDDDESDTILLAEAPETMTDNSGLDSQPDRGDFDEFQEEEFEKADFGVESRAIEENA